MREGAKDMNIDMHIYRGRPADETGRSRNETACYDFLDGLGILYDRADHEETDTMEKCAEVKSVLGLHICKNLFLTTRNGKGLYLLLMPGDKQFKTSVVSKLIGTSRLSFGTPEKMTELIGAAPGSASVLGLMFDRENKVRIVIDRDAVKDEYFGCHPCRNTSSVKVKTADLMEKILPALGHEPLIIDIPYQKDGEN